MAGQSYRLLALAVGELKDVTPAELASMTQQDAEALAGPLDLTGLLVLSNDLHSASKDTIANLQDKYAAMWLCRVLISDSCCAWWIWSVMYANLYGHSTVMSVEVALYSSLA